MGKFRPKTSKSQIAQFRACERQYLYAYKFWDFSPPLKRECWFRRKPMGQYGLVGQITDDMITAMLRRFRDYQAWPDNLEDAASKLIRQYAESSTEFRTAYDSGEVEPPEPRRQPIESFTWIGPPESDQVEAIKSDVVRHTQVWFNSSVRREIEGCNVSSWRIQEPKAKTAPTFPFQDIDIYAKYDFAMVEDGSCTIYDWKTGKLTGNAEESVREQLHTYGLYAQSEWKVPLDRMALVAVWLSLGSENCRAEIRVDAAYAVTIPEEWRKTVLSIESRIKPLRFKGDEAIEDAFPMTENLRTCQDCPFVHCAGKKRLAG